MAMSQKEKTDYKRKYNEDKYSRIGLYIFPEEKDRWQAAADAQDISLSEFIKRCVNEKLDHQ